MTPTHDVKEGNLECVKTDFYTLLGCVEGPTVVN